MARRRGPLRKKSTWVTQDFLISRLRRQMVRGYYPPGSRLPTRDELELQYRASRITIQRAFDVLIAEGFVITRGRLGSFVSVTPPHIFHFGMVMDFPRNPGEEEPGLNAALRKAGRAATIEGPQRVKLFGGLNTPDDIAGYFDLVEDVQVNRMAGLIFVGPAAHLEESPLLQEPGFPRAAVTAGRLRTELPRIELDRDAFFAQALDHVQRKKRARVSLIASGPRAPYDMAALQRNLTKGGAIADPAWIHEVHVNNAEHVAGLVALMMSHRKAAPNAIILTEEAFARHAAAGLKAARVRARDVSVVSQCFFVPGRRRRRDAVGLGYDAEQILMSCFEVIGAQRKRGVPRKVTKVKPTFETGG